MIRAAVALAALAGTAGCVPQHTVGSVRTVQSTVTRTSAAPSSTFVAPAPRTAAGLPPGAMPPKGQVAGRCPWIASTPEQDAKVNVADLNGSHVYRTTITTSHPVSCSFYFYAPPYQAQVDITVRVFASPRDMRDAIVLTARTGTQLQGRPGIAPGVDAILYRTRFFAPDGARDWACVFSAGSTMVIVRTDRTDTSLNALLIAKAIAGKF